MPTGSYASSPDLLVKQALTLWTGEVYSFVITDSGGNGLCCMDGNKTSGWYQIYRDGDETVQESLVYGAGDFRFKQGRYFTLDNHANESKTVDLIVTGSQQQLTSGIDQLYQLGNVMPSLGVAVAMTLAILS